MSYCRFSSDDFQCDVYAYESCLGGWQVHVAGIRYVYKEPLPEPVSIENFQAWLDRHQKVGQMVDQADRVPIGLSRDGQSLWAETAGGCADLLEDLKREGYRVPDYAIEALRIEATETGED